MDIYARYKAGAYTDSYDEITYSKNGRPTSLFVYICCFIIPLFSIGTASFEGHILRYLWRHELVSLEIHYLHLVWPAFVVASIGMIFRRKWAYYLVIASSIGILLSRFIILIIFSSELNSFDYSFKPIHWSLYFPILMFYLFIVITFCKSLNIKAHFGAYSIIRSVKESSWYQRVKFIVGLIIFYKIEMYIYATRSEVHPFIAGWLYNVYKFFDFPVWQ